MPHPLVEKAKVELEQAQSQLDAALHAWDASVSELWRTSLALTQAQKRVTYAHELLRNALDAVEDQNVTTKTKPESSSGT
jgi:hypothetical protein